MESCLNHFELYLSQIIREFLRLQEIASAAGEVQIPIPTTAMLSSYTSHQRLRLRGGVAVGGQSLQSIVDFAEDHTLKPTTKVNEGFCVRYSIDCEREDPFFAMILSTKTLMSSFESSRPIETDETFKVMHEGYALTLIGQSDMNRVWHLRYRSLRWNLIR